jgi:hypothetical protein
LKRASPADRAFFRLFKNYKNRRQRRYPPALPLQSFKERGKLIVLSIIIYAIAAGWFRKLPENRRKFLIEGEVFGVEKP